MTVFPVPGTGGEEQEQNNVARSRNVPGTTSGTLGAVPDLVPVPISQERGTDPTAAIGCPDCTAEVDLNAMESNVYVATIRHDKTCPTLWKQVAR